MLGEKIVGEFFPKEEILSRIPSFYCPLYRDGKKHSFITSGNRILRFSNCVWVRYSFCLGCGVCLINTKNLIQPAKEKN